MFAMGLVTPGILLSILLTWGTCMNSDLTSISRYGTSYIDLASLHQDAHSA